MRVIVIGAGAVGGTIGARLHQAGYDVALVARGPHGTAIRNHGLVLATPHERVTLAIPVHPHPREITWRDDDVAVLATKSQDTEAAARHLVAAAGPDVPVVSAQNGVTNEATLSRWFAHVHGMCVMVPTDGGSTSKRLQPGADVETGYLNGEIALTAPSSGAAAPPNAGFRPWSGGRPQTAPVPAT